MTDPDQILEIFNEAKARAAGADRDAFVTQACRDDAELQEQVRSLLLAHDRAGEFLQGAPTLSPEIEAELARLKPEAAGDRIGCYKLLQEIGEGGFGTVWMAEQMEPVSRRVALKIIKLGMDTKEVIARFEFERQALAMMDHPNIAQVFEAGATQFGRPFFVMELVKGVPITEYCDAHQLRARQRLELFGDVCSAINHAHQKGVIHRDIKPSNVMITLHGDTPVVKVIDFGIAKATQGKLTDKTLFTRFEQFIGTPAYMSPEQAATSGLDIDTRSDIYALGILLYELLTGTPPFDAKSLASAGYEEMLRIIREVEPVKPSSRVGTMAGEERAALAKAHHIKPEELHRLVEPDLDWIVMKAIDKDRARRYETANGLARDIAHFLADEPVSATPPSASYRFRKFARRNKAALRVAAAIAILLIAATIVSSWQAIRATNAEKLTIQRLAESEQARAEAEAVSTFMAEVFQSPEPYRDGRNITVAETLDKAAKKLETDLAGHPARQATLRTTLAVTYHSLALYDRAIPLMEKLVEYYRIGSGPEHPLTLNVMVRLASSYYGAGRQEEAVLLTEKALALSRKTLGAEHTTTQFAMNNLANYHDAAGRNEKALELREELLKLRRKVLGLEHSGTLVAMSGLAASYIDTGRWRDALELCEEVLALRRKVNGLEHHATYNAMSSLAYCYSYAGRYEEALRLDEEVLAFLRNASGPRHPDTMLAMHNLGTAYYLAGRWEEALALREETLALRQEVSGAEHPSIPVTMMNLATSYARAGRHDEALEVSKNALALARKVLGPEDRATLSAMNGLASHHVSAHRWEEAIALLEPTVQLYFKVLGPKHRDALGSMLNLAIAYHNVGRPADGIRLMEEVLAACRKELSAAHPLTARAMHNLAAFYAGAGRQEEAVELWKEALVSRRKALGSPHPDTLKTMVDLATSLRKIGDVAGADALEKEIADAKANAKPVTR